VLEALADRWLTTRPMAPMGFLVRLDLFSFLEERRFFVAEHEGRVVGALGCVPVYTRGGWLFEDLLRVPDAPNGTADVLIDCAMRDIAADGASYATLGLAPLAGRVSGWLRAARRWGRPLYDFDGIRAFKARLRPHAWDPIYLSYPRDQIGMVAVLDTLRAFAEGGLVRFAVETLRRRVVRSPRRRLTG
jgi:phosphatidylglycerol lysyltransferase